jgi:hypothetical protein
MTTLHQDDGRNVERSGGLWYPAFVGNPRGKALIRQLPDATS